MKLFIKEDGVLKLHREEIALIKEFNNLLRRKNPCSEDEDGSKKIMNFKEFLYIYHLCDYESYPNQNGLNDKEAHKWAIEAAAIHGNWKPDEVVKNAMVRYMEVSKSPAREQSKEILATLNLATKLTKRLREHIENSLLKLDTGTTEEKNSIDLNQLVTNLNTVIDISGRLPKQIENMKAVKKLIADEEGQVEVIRGGNEVLDSMTLDNEIDKR